MRCVFLVLTWVLSSLVFGSTLFSLRLEALPEVVVRSRSTAALDQDSLVELSLLLSGAAPSTTGAYRGVLDRWSAEFQAQSKTIVSDDRRAEALLEFLHSHLKSYSTYQTRLDVLIDRGTYNCVSSAVAYMVLGRAAGLDVQAVATDDHAFALVRLSGGREVDVETTTRHGFDPGTKTEFTDSFGQTGFAYVPPGNYQRRTTIGDRQLLGLLVQNRMADFQRAGKAEDAVGPAIDRWVLEASPQSFRTLIDGFVNYGASLNNRKEYAKGLDLVDQMAVWTGPVPEAKDLAWAFLNNHLGTLLARENFTEAETLAARWADRGFLAPNQLAATLGTVADRRLSVLIKTWPWSQAVEEVAAAYAQGKLTAARRQELLTFTYGQEVQRVSAQQGPAKAWNFIATLPAEARNWPSLVKAREVCAYNWAVEVHNRFAELWNKGNKDEARRILREAQAALPDSALLKKDLALSQGQ